MTYIYLTVWKIGKFLKVKYEDSLLFVCPYQGSKVNFKEIKSIFEFSELPEKDIFEFFSLIGIDNGYIKSIKKLIDTRNQMAHATGTFQISTEEDFKDAIEELMSIPINLQDKMNITIRKWYQDELLNYAKCGLNEGYSPIKDYINEEYVLNLSFSQKDLFACNEFGLSKFKNSEYNLSKTELRKMKIFHTKLKNIFNDLS